MIYLIAAVAVFAILVWAGRGGLSRHPGGVRLAGGGMTLLLLVAAGVVSLRGAWMLGLVFLVLAMGGAFATRGAVRSTPDVSLDEARSILGVGPDATEAEIREAHSRLMRVAHPDKGGTSGLAAQLNAARDRLLNR